VRARSLHSMGLLDNHEFEMIKAAIIRKQYPQMLH
jgi:hypothetical protein